MTSPDQVAYRVEGLSKAYPRQEHPANDGIELEIASAEIFGLLGDNGAGKSTLVKQLVGLLRPDAGRVSLFGRDVATDPGFAALTVGYMPQSAFALNNLTVGEAIYFSAHLRGGLTRRQARTERDELIGRWGLEPVAGKPSRQLSGGQRRLLQLAVAMAGKPPVLVLDEPTNDLDPQRRRLVWDVLRELNAERGCTVIFITHDAAEAEKVIQRVGIMRAGKLVALGRPSELKRQVDRKLRLELVYPPEVEPVLPDIVAWHRQDRDRWLAYLDPQQVKEIMDRVDLSATEDFRLQSATLEDLYLHFAEAVGSHVG